MIGLAEISPDEKFQFSCGEIADVLEAAEQELLVRGSCKGQTAQGLGGPVCAIGAINLAIFGPGCADGLYYYNGADKDQKAALRDAVATAMGFSSFVEIGGGFHDLQTSDEPTLNLFRDTRARLLSF